MENLEIYEKVRSVPDNAKKDILAGRLKGMTDINPMWRIEKLTEVFGPCGIGWYYNITDRQIIEGANNEKIAIVSVALLYKTGENAEGEEVWSKPIYGTGGSKFIAKENNGLFTSDECFKMALTDALSVACKALGVGADVYWNKNDDKYTNIPPQQQGQSKQYQNKITQKPKLITEAQRKRLFSIANGNNEIAKRVIERYGYEKSEQIKMSDYDKICTEIESELLM